MKFSLKSNTKELWSQHTFHRCDQSSFLSYLASASLIYSFNSDIFKITASAPASKNEVLTFLHKLSFSSCESASYSSSDNPNSELPSITPMDKTPAFFPSLISEIVSPTFTTFCYRCNF